MAGIKNVRKTARIDVYVSTRKFCDERKFSERKPRSQNGRKGRRTFFHCRSRIFVALPKQKASHIVLKQFCRGIPRHPQLKGSKFCTYSIYVDKSLYSLCRNYYRNMLQISRISYTCVKQYTNCIISFFINVLITLIVQFIFDKCTRIRKNYTPQSNIRE